MDIALNMKIPRRREFYFMGIKKYQGGRKKLLCLIIDNLKNRFSFVIKEQNGLVV